MRESPPQFLFPKPESSFETPHYEFHPGDHVTIQFTRLYQYQMRLSIVCGDTALSFAQAIPDSTLQNRLSDIFTYDSITLDSEYWVVEMPLNNTFAAYPTCRFAFSEGIPGISKNSSQSGFFKFRNDSSVPALLNTTAMATESLSNTVFERGLLTPGLSQQTPNAVSVIPFLTPTITFPTTSLIFPVPSEPPPESSLPIEPSSSTTEFSSFSFSSASSVNTSWSMGFFNTTFRTIPTTARSTTASTSMTSTTTEPSSEPSQTDDIFNGPIIDPLTLDPTPLFDEVNTKTVIGIMAGVPGLVLTGIFIIFCYRLQIYFRLMAKERAQKKKDETARALEAPENTERPVVEASGALPISQIIRNSFRRDSGARSVRFELDVTEASRGEIV
ncbi:hypothetical protein PVAG01_10641 [Phlyctema vagabunda]|uniref:Uncharacterized protein n=1 Tax=Phlyctema vagabunda TaxID=108571 RepID=A0ABR4P2V1_9HELO